ncbi:MAG: NDP-sugar synthase [Syntrophobacteraceae bacterium]
MKAGIIAAGLGERLARGGISTPKPLTPIAGRPLIARIIDASAKLNVSSVACIVNAENLDVANYLLDNRWPVPLELIVKTTPSSMESLFSLAHLLRDEPFILFTVDVIAGFETLADFFEQAKQHSDASGVLALTEFVDDEKPLWAMIDPGNRIIALGDDARESRYVTAGFYCFSPEIFSLMDIARGKKLSALRQFLNLLIEKDFPLYGIPVAKTIDVDFPEDIEKAEAFLKEIGEL